METTLTADGFAFLHEDYRQLLQSPKNFNQLPEGLKSLLTAQINDRLWINTVLSLAAITLNGEIEPEILESYYQTFSPSPTKVARQNPWANVALALSTFPDQSLPRPVSRKTINQVNLEIGQTPQACFCLGTAKDFELKPLPLTLDQPRRLLINAESAMSGSLINTAIKTLHGGKNTHPQVIKIGENPGRDDVFARRMNVSARSWWQQPVKERTRLYIDQPVLIIVPDVSLVPAGTPVADNLLSAARYNHPNIHFLAVNLVGKKPDYDWLKISTVVVNQLRRGSIMGFSLAEPGQTIPAWTLRESAV